MKKRPSNLLVNNLIQFVFIFSSVYFAFWLTNLNEDRKIKKIEEKAIKAIHLELLENIKQLDKAIKFHEDIRDKLFLYGDSLEKRLIDPTSMKPQEHISKTLTKTSNSLGFPNLSRDAWEMLQNSSAYTALDYDIANNLRKLYSLQEGGVESTMQSIVSKIFNDKAQFDETQSESMVFLTAWSFRELHGQEQYLYFSSKQTVKVLEESFEYLP